MKAKVEGKKLILELPLEKPRASKSGKTRVVYSTGGFTDAKVEYEKEPIKINITATIPNKD